MKPRAALLGLITLSLSLSGFYYYWGWSHFAGYTTDDALYLLLADFFSPYHDNTTAAAQYAFDQRLHPPVFPWLLALAGAGSETVLRAHQVTLSFLLLALGAFYYWLRIEHSARWQAVGLVLVWAMMPFTLLLNTEIWSENTYLTLSLLTLAWANRQPLPQLPTQTAIALALLIGLVAITRTAGLALVGAWLWACLRHTEKQPLRTGLLIGFSLVPLFMLAAWNAYYPTASKGYLGNWLYYVSAQVEQHGLAAFVVNYLQLQLHSLWNAWGTVMTGLEGPPPQPMGLIVLLLTITGGWLMRLKQQRLDAVYILLYLGILLIWPYQDHLPRFIYAVLPILLLYGAQGIQALGKGMSRRWLQHNLLAVYGLIMVLVAAPNSYFIVLNFLEPIPAALEPYKRTRYYLKASKADSTANASQISQGRLNLLHFYQQTYSALNQIKTLIPPQACVYSISPELIMLFSGRVSYLWPLPPTSDAEFKQQTQACDYFFLTTDESPKFPRFYPRERLTETVTTVQVTYLDPAHPDSGVIAVLLRRD